MQSVHADTERNGFTLIELLIVVVVIGVLAAIMVIRGTAVQREANEAVLRSDLRSVAVLQEIHHQSALEYAVLDDLDSFRVSDGVTVELNWVDPDGYAVTATHTGLPDTVCGVFRGPAPTGAAGPAETEGVIACD